MSMINKPAIEELVKEILTAGKLTITARQYLKTALLDESISEEELSWVEQVIEAVRNGQLTLVLDS